MLGECWVLASLSFLRSAARQRQALTSTLLPLNTLILLPANFQLYTTGIWVMRA